MTKPTVRKGGLRVSLRLAFLIVLILSTTLSVCSFLLVSLLGNNYINNEYMSEQNRDERERQYVLDLQNYVADNDLSSKDTSKIAKWVRENKYLYVMLFTLDDQLILDSGMAEKDEEQEPTVDGTEGGDSQPAPDGDTDGEGGDEGEAEDGYKPGGLLNDLTREQLIEIARANDSHPIILSDTTILASMADFSEYFYYDVVNISGFALAAVIFISIAMAFFYYVTKRITKLSDDVTRVAAGDMNHEIRPSRGTDEIARLSENVENMRSSIIQNLENERAARNANSELITAMSHDIRTPLTVLLGYVDMMKLHATDEVMADYVKATEKTALRLKTLSDDMFNYFLMFGGDAPEITIENYNAATLLEQMLAEYVILLKEKGYEVELMLDEAELAGLYISTDASALMRIVENIFSNLIKYANADRPVLIKVLPLSGGIALEMSNSISAVPTAESSGIGLKTCVKLSELLGIKFSTLADGDIFRVSMLLPASAEPAALLEGEK